MSLSLSQSRFADPLTVPVRTDENVVAMRKLVREKSLEIKLSLVDQTKFITAASELARNMLRYAGGGEVHFSLLSKGNSRGLCLDFIDQGPGILDIAQALVDGFTTGDGLGLGLGGAKRLVDDFDIQSELGKGTKVSIVKWKK
jgi:serine/threonine-protein kinase RsbT